jgi:hypothetical protein
MYLRMGLYVFTKSVAIKINVYDNSLVCNCKSRTRYLINEIVVAEESDLTIDGRRQSHYEMYIEAMKDCGASTVEIESFLGEVNSLKYFCCYKDSNLHPNIKAFLDFTFSVIDKETT